METIIRNLKKIVGEEYIKTGEPMAEHCTFRCGGKAAVYVIPASIDEVVQVVKCCRENNQKFMVFGNGSNLLVRDGGYDGVMIEIGSRISAISVIGEELEVEAGAKLSVTASVAMESDLSGME